MGRAMFIAAFAAVAIPAHAGDLTHAEAIRAHTAYLASDELAGRDPGTPGYDKAATYVAERLREAGLVPVEGQKDYFQNVRIQKRSLKEKGVDFTLTIAGRAHAFENGVGIAVDAGRDAEVEDISAPIVFAGYGISAPGHDDFAELDVKGKAIAILEGAPASLPPTLRAHYSWSVTKEEMAAARGAVALLTIKGPERERVSPWERTRQGRPLPAQSWIAPDGRPQPALPWISIGPDVVERLFAGHGGSAALFAREAEGRAGGFRLEASMHMRRRSDHVLVDSANVAAVLPGTDPVLSREYVMVTGHLDHVGIGPAVGGDAIYNGAVDNAGGIAVMIEVAKRIAKAGGTRRTLLFLSTTAEEKGLLGAYYFAANPLIPLDRVAALVNIDGLPLFHDYSDIVALGADNASIGPDVRAAAAANGAVLSPDPAPERGNLALSDQYPFLRYGIPVLFANPGIARGRDGSDGAALLARFGADRYHKPSDDMSAPIRWDQAARWSDFTQDVIVRLANRADRPLWYAGDPLGEHFAPDAPKTKR